MDVEAQVASSANDDRVELPVQELPSVETKTLSTSEFRSLWREFLLSSKGRNLDGVLGSERRASILNFLSGSSAFDLSVPFIPAFVLDQHCLITPLFWAASMDDVEMMRALLDIDPSHEHVNGPALLVNDANLLGEIWYHCGDPNPASSKQNIAPPSKGEE